MSSTTVAMLLSFLGFAVVQGNSFSVESQTPKTTTITSFWDGVPQGPPDAILGIAQAFRECTDARKVNVCVGAYRDENGRPWILPSVRQAETMLTTEDKEYLPIEGDGLFLQQALRFAYGDEQDLECIAGVQSLSGTGACRIGAEFLQQYGASKTILIPTPTWGNHWKIFQNAGLNCQPYRYYDYTTNGLDLQGLLQDLEQAPEHSIVLLHACAHNPTGCDPSPEQWEQIIAVLEKKQHTAFFDSAYQGFASGNAEADAAAFRRVVNQKTIPVLLAQSFAKNFGLYGERCGTFSVVCANPEEKQRVLSQLKWIIRPMYSSPPKHGSSLVRTVLMDDVLRPQYYQECAHMADRIQSMRARLVQELAAVGSQHDWSHISKQIGMFAFTGMNEEMCNQLTQEYAIFLTKDGRISVAGLNESNLHYVAKAMHTVTDRKSITQSK